MQIATNTQYFKEPGNNSNEEATPNSPELQNRNLTTKLILVSYI